MKPTTAKQTEVGVKYQPHGSRSSVTAAVYDLKQQNVASYDTSSYSYQQTGEVGSKGFELETNLQLTGAWHCPGCGNNECFGIPHPSWPLTRASCIFRDDLASDFGMSRPPISVSSGH